MTQWSLWSLVLQNRSKLFKKTMEFFTSSCCLPPPSYIPVTNTYHLCIASYIRRTPNLHVKMTFHLIQNSVDELGRSFWMNGWFFLDSPTVPGTRVAHRLTRWLIICWVSKTGSRASVSLWVGKSSPPPPGSFQRYPQSSHHRITKLQVLFHSYLPTWIDKNMSQDQLSPAMGRLTAS